MTGHPATRPASLTASAVLLIVVGCELLLAGAVGIGASIWWGITDGEPPNIVLIGLAAILLGVGVELLVIAVKTLRGTLRKPWFAGDRVVGFGALAALPTLALSCCCGVSTVADGKWEKWLTTDAAYGIAGMVGLWANTAAVVTAGVLLRNNADRYFVWQGAIRQPVADAEYEPEES